MTRAGQSRELEIAVYWRDWRELCGLKFLRLEDFLDNRRHGMCVQLEPQGILFMEVSSFQLSSRLFHLRLLGLMSEASSSR